MSISKSFLPLLSLLFIVIVSCDTTDNNQAELGSFEATISGEMQKHMQGDASYPIGTVPLLDFNGDPASITIMGALGGSPQSLAKGHFPIRHNDFFASDTTNDPTMSSYFTANYQPCPLKCSEENYNGFRGEIIIDKIENNRAEGTFSFDAKRINRKGSFVKGSDSIHVEGTFQASGIHITNY